MISGLITGTLEGLKETPWGGWELSVQVSGLDRKGRPVTSYIDARIDKFQAEDGLQNAYRPFLGKSVYVPVAFSIYQKENGGRAYEQVDVTGVPLNLQVVQPVKAAS